MSEAKWYCLRDGKEVGPLGRDQLKQMADAGVVRPEDSVRREGDVKWVLASRVRGLCPEPVSKAEPPPPPPSMSVPAAGTASVVPALTAPAPGRPAEERTGETLDAIARWRRRLRQSVLLWLFAGAGALIGVSYGSVGAIVLFWPLVCYRLARALGFSGTPRAVLALVPIVNLFALLRLNNRAGEVLWVSEVRGGPPRTRTTFFGSLGTFLGLVLMAFGVVAVTGIAEAAVRKTREIVGAAAKPKEAPPARQLSFGNGQVVTIDDDGLAGDAKRLGEVLKEVGYFGGKTGGEVILGRRGSDVLVRVVTKADAIDRPLTRAMNGDDLGVRLAAKAFPGRPVVVQLCDELLKDGYSVRFGPTALHQVTPNCAIYHPAALQAEASRLGELIKKQEIETVIPEWVLDSKGGAWTVTAGRWGTSFDTKGRQPFAALSALVSSEVFAGERVEVKAVIDNSLETFPSSR